MRSLSVCFSLLALSACLSVRAQEPLSETEKLSAEIASCQGLTLKQRLIHKEYLLQKYQTPSLFMLLEQKGMDADINQISQYEETIALGKPTSTHPSSSLSNILHTAGFTHLEGLYTHHKDTPFLTRQSPDYQDAFQIELATLCDVSRIFNPEEWVPFRLRADAELTKCLRRPFHRNTFYADVQKQAQTRLMAEHLQQATAKQR